MKGVNTLKKRLEVQRKKVLDDLLAMTESPIEEMFLLYLLNFLEKSIYEQSDFNELSISGYSYISVDPVVHAMNERTKVGINVINAGTGFSIEYPKGVPMSDGTFVELTTNHIKRSKSLQESSSSNCFSFIQDLHIYPQYEVDVCEKSFRLDFALLLYESINHEMKLVKKMGIECDGYDYHASPEQFNRDRKRARLLQQDDWIIVRYSGSEINQMQGDNYDKEIFRLFDMLGFGIISR